jgi:DNA-binding transcriptional ArsR family regulator
MKYTHFVKQHFAEKYIKFYLKYPKFTSLNCTITKYFFLLFHLLFFDQNLYMYICTVIHMKQNDVCEIEVTNEKTVNDVKSHMPDEDLLLEVSETYKIFGDLTRLKILQALYQRELCVCDLTAVLEANQSTISHQLRILRSKNLVKFRKEGKMVYYSLADEHVVKIIEMGIEHVTEK